MAEEETITEPTATPSAEDQNPTETFTTLLESIKEGDRQKYNTVEDALQSIPNAQEHIQSLKEKNEELEKQLQQAQSIDALMAKLEEKATSQANQPQAEQVFDESKLSSLLDQTLTQREQQQKAQANVDTVITELKSKFGDKAEEVYEKVAAESGVGVDFLNQMAAKSPRAVLQLAGVSEQTKQPAPAPITSQFNSEAHVQNQEKPSARVAMVGASSEDIANAWRNTMPKEN